MSEEDQAQDTLANVPMIRAGDRGLILNSLEAMRDTAQIILQSGFCPDGYTKKEQVFVALQTGAELGLPPIQALNSIAIIRGKPRLWGDAALALVKTSGLLVEYEEKVEGEGEDMIATVVSVRKDGEVKSRVETTFTVADAKTAKLWNKKDKYGGDTTWVTHPKRMLKYKARAFNLRDNFPDVLMGLHLAEEMIGEEPLPAPQCDTPKRGDRIKVENTNNHPPQAESEAAGTEAGSGGSADQDTIRDMAECCCERLREILSEAFSQVAIPQETITFLFCKLCAIVLGGDEMDYTMPESLNVNKLSLVKERIETEVPQEILDAFEPEPLGIPEEEAEKHSEEKFGTHYRYICKNPKCLHSFNELAPNDICPRCLRKDITDNGPEPTGGSEEK